MQLTFIDTLYKARTPAEKSLLKNIEQLIKNFKYIRAHVQTKLGLMYDKNKKFDQYSRVESKIGFCMYWLATLGYLKNSEIGGEDIQSQDEWYTKTVDKAYLSTSEMLSAQKLYSIANSNKSLSNELKRVYSRLLFTNSLSDKIINSYIASQDDLIDMLHKLKLNETN